MKTVFVCVLLLLPSQLFAQPAPAEVTPLPPEVLKQMGSDLPVAKPVDHKETAKYCPKFEGSYISYYGEVYKIEKCHKRNIQSSQIVFDLNRSRTKIRAVESEVIQAFADGEPIGAETNHKHKTCKELAGKYVTYSQTDIFYVENCKKRLFPDWQSYDAHRHKHHPGANEILALTYQEFQALAEGPDFASDLDSNYARQGIMPPPDADVIPAEEACRGLEGKIVSFYSKLYRIEKCRKREIDPEQFTMNRANRGVKILTLKPSQYVSIPDALPHAKQ